MEQSDPTGRQPQDPGAKLDAGKIPLHRGVFQQFPQALCEVARLSEYGARKYSWGGWKSVPDGQQRYADARARHEIQHAQGLLIDHETGLLHLTAVAWNALAELELFLSGDTNDVNPTQRLTSKEFFGAR